ncbi:MAG TPA: FlgD immunoglobulin-like domain containing protein [Candidatus Megaira endosymbiont of Hartmannula sinica]|nr:FlgD immunoglobulin-like domain containing protein [Candidatus Megaera endosymbiont of Hartmannula sinica]
MPQIDRNRNQPTDHSQYSAIKNISQKKGNNINKDFKKLIEECNKLTDNVDKICDDSLKIALAEAKNSGIGALMGEGDNSNSGMQNSMAQIQQQKMLSSQVKASIISSEISMAAAKGSIDYLNKNISYKDDVRYFSGKQNSNITDKSSYEEVKFSYNIEHNSDPSLTINSNVTIKDINGKTVYRSKQTSKVGKNQFVWDGTNTKGETAQAGEYKISVESNAVDSNGKKVNITSSSEIMSVVTKELFDSGSGIKNKLQMANGDIIDLDQICSIQNSNIDNKNNYITVSEARKFVGNRADIDLSLTKVKNNKLYMRYNYQNEHSTSANIIIKNLDGKIVRNITRTISPSQGNDRRNNLDIIDDIKLADGFYKILIKTKNSETGRTERLNSKINDLTIMDVENNGTVTSIDGVTFDVTQITNIGIYGNYPPA